MSIVRLVSDSGGGADRRAMRLRMAKGRCLRRIRVDLLRLTAPGMVRRLSEFGECRTYQADYLLAMEAGLVHIPTDLFLAVVELLDCEVRFLAEQAAVTMFNPPPLRHRERFTAQEPADG